MYAGSKRWFQQTFEISHGRPTIAAMEGLRGIAVFLVFLVHYSSLSQPWIPLSSSTALIASHLHNIGNAGVDLFFVLSGYLIYGTVLRKAVPFGQYLSRRVQRIYPTFLFVLAVYLVLAVLAPGERAFPSEWPARLLYVAENVLLLPGMFDIRPIVTVAWSLSYEFFYYLAVPTMIGALVLRRWTPRSRMALFVAIAVAGFVTGWSESGHIRLLMFVAGILLYELTATPTPLRVTSSAGALALAGAIAAMVLVKVADLGDGAQTLMLFVCFLVLCLDAFNPAGRTARMLSAPLLRAYGNISYSYYLVHGLTLKIAFTMLGRVYPGEHATSWLFWILLVPAFVLTLIPSVGLFLLIEKPWSLTSRAKSPGALPRMVLPTEPANV
jgi:exopolysaccharide production protein ExoZ